MYNIAYYFKSKVIDELSCLCFRKKNIRYKNAETRKRKCRNEAHLNVYSLTCQRIRVEGRDENKIIKMKGKTE